jgi:hypothetical protein
MKTKTVVNILLAAFTIDLVLVASNLTSSFYAQILYIAAAVLGLWFIMRMFNVKPLASRL